MSCYIMLITSLRAIHNHGSHMSLISIGCDYKGLRVVVPQAPLMPITALGEAEERTW
jgi:hypothetical protein